MLVTGQCHCGHVRYQAEIDPDEIGICHCTDCQRLTGSPFRVTAHVPEGAIIVTGNPPKIYRKAGESGAIRRQYFCPECGSPLFTSADGEGEWGIRWGSIDEREKLIPSTQIWTRSGVHWLGEISDIPASEKE
jgi:hypothetical protein